MGVLESATERDTVGEIESLRDMEGLGVPLRHCVVVAETEPPPELLRDAEAQPVE